MSEVSMPVYNGTEEQETATTLQNERPFKKWMGLGVLSLGLAIIIIDTTLLNVSLSTIIKDLNTDLQSIQWVITAYALVLAAFTITGGRFGDLFGRRRMFMLGAVIFAVGSFMASMSHSMFTLLMGESIIEGVGAAIMMPATASLVVANFKGKERATAFGVWGGVAGASSAIGPLLGGYLTSHFSWRWGFRINVFIAALVLIGSLLYIKDSRDEHKPHMDWFGVVLSSLGLLGIVYGIIESSTYGWLKAKEIATIAGHQINLGSVSIVPVVIGIGAVLLTAFMFWERRVEKSGKTPLVSSQVLKNRQFTAGSLTTMILTLGMSGQVFALPIFLQAVKNLDAFHTGLALLPLSASMLIVAPLTGVLTRKIAPKYFILAGMLIDVAAAFVLRSTIHAGTTVTHLIPGLIMYGVGMAMVMAPISNLTLSSVPTELAGEASGINNTLRQVGSTLGAAIIGAAVLTSLTTSLAKGIQNSPVIPNGYRQPIIEKVTSPTSNVEFGVQSSGMEGVPPVVTQEITALAHEAAAHSTRDAYIYNAMFLFLGFLAALFLPKRGAHEHGTQENVVHEEHSGRKFAFAGIAAVVAIAGGVWLLHRSSGTVIASGVQPQQAEVGASSGAFAVPSPQVQGATTPTPAPAVSAPSDNQTAPTPTAAPVMRTYKNSALGFEMQISDQWQAREEGNDVMFTSADGKIVSVQSFDGVSDDLETIRRQLEGSPSVRSITPTTFKGQSALSFTTMSGRKGIAVFYNSRLYYIMGTSLGGDPVDTFRFM